MKETIAFSRFDAELNTDCCDAYNNAELTLTLKLGFNQINPTGTAATGQHHDYGDPTEPNRTISRWTPGAWATWKEQFTSTAQAFWNGKFWLVNDAGLFSYFVGRTVYVPNVYCKLKIVASDGAAGNHHTIDVVRMPNTSAWFGSHSTLYDSNDIRAQSSGTDSTGRTLMQRAHVHEVGHLLGLGHVDIGQPHCPASGDTNATACYGVSDTSMHSVMGAGMTIRLENAEPWRNAIRGFALAEARRNGARAGRGAAERGGGVGHQFAVFADFRTADASVGIVARQDDAALSAHRGRGAKRCPDHLARQPGGRLTTRRTVRVLATLALLSLGGAVWVAGRGLADDVTGPTVGKKECRMNRLEQSACVIEAILADLRATYRLAGEISGIKQNSTTSFTARVSREGRVDEFTYEFEMADDGAVKIVGKVEE